MTQDRPINIDPNLFLAFENLLIQQANTKLQLINEDSRKAIIGRVNHDEYGIFGTCYSQPNDFVDKLCEQNSTVFFDNETLEHELGQWTVDIVICALNALPNIKAWQTPPHSLADLKWKWDLMIEHESYLYPVQIKSSLDAIKECKEIFRDNLYNKKEQIFDEITKKKDKYENKIQDYIQKKRLFSQNDSNIVAIKKQRDKEIEKLNNLLENYKKSSPLDIWASRDEDTIKALIHVFSELFSIDVNLLKIEVQALKEYKNKYINIQEILIAEEKDKLKVANELISLIQEYLRLKTDNLTKKSLINTNTGKPNRLEDTLCIKKGNKSLELAEYILKYYNKCLSIAHESYEDKIIPKENSKTIESYKLNFKIKVLKSIQQEKNNARNILDKKVESLLKNYVGKEPDIEKITELVASKEKLLINQLRFKYIENHELDACLEKLIYFDVNSSYPSVQILKDIKEKLTYLLTQEVTLTREKIEQYTEEYLLSIYFE